MFVCIGVYTLKFRSLQLFSVNQWAFGGLVKPQPAQLKIQLVSGQEMVLYEPAIIGYSIIGGLSRNWKPAGGAWTHEVVNTSTRESSALRTTIVVVAVTAAVLATLQGLKKGLDADYGAAGKVR